MPTPSCDPSDAVFTVEMGYDERAPDHRVWLTNLPPHEVCLVQGEAPLFVEIELGPETKALLKALIERLA